MSLTQTYYLAHTARGKLSKEAARGDHDLRLLVGHANLLDGLMLDLAHAEEEQESWFNHTVTTNTKAAEPKHIQWADTIPEDVEEAVEEEFYAESSDSDSDSDDEMEVAEPMPTRRAPTPQTTVTTSEVDDDEDMEDEDYEEDLALTRTSSIHPPELLQDSDSDSDDESMPPSPPTAEAPLDAFSEKQRQAIVTTSYYPSISDKSDSPSQIPETEQASFFDEGYYLPQRQTAIATF